METRLGSSYRMEIAFGPGVVLKNSGVIQVAFYCMRPAQIWDDGRLVFFLPL